MEHKFYYYISLIEFKIHLSISFYVIINDLNTKLYVISNDSPF